MNQVFYNPNSVPTDEPHAGEAFYWLTAENSKLYANFKVYGIPGVKTIEVNEPETFDADEVLAEIVESMSERISFTSANDESVTWNGNVAEFTHNLACMPVVTIYDSNMNIVMPDISATDSSHFTVNFGSRSAVTGTWTCVVNYGSEW